MNPPATRSSAGARRLVLAALLAVVAIAFVIVFAARPAVILTAAGHDDALFARHAPRQLVLAQGRLQ